MDDFYSVWLVGSAAEGDSGAVIELLELVAIANSANKPAPPLVAQWFSERVAELKSIHDPAKRPSDKQRAISSAFGYTGKAGRKHTTSTEKFRIAREILHIMREKKVKSGKAAEFCLSVSPI